MRSGYERLEYQCCNVYNIVLCLTKMLCHNMKVDEVLLAVALLSAGLPLLWWCVLKADVQIDRPFKKGDLSEETLRSMPTLQENNT